MDFEYRQTVESDYKTMKDWWRWHRFPVPQRFILPDDFSSGLMISYRGEDLCSGFIYKTSSSSLFWMEYIVSNYTTKDNKVRSEGKKLLINGLTYMAKNAGAKVIYTSVIQSNLKQDLLECGFITGSSNADEMICIIP